MLFVFTESILTHETSRNHIIPRNRCVAAIYFFTWQFNQLSFPSVSNISCSSIQARSFLFMPYYSLQFNIVPMHCNSTAWNKCALLLAKDCFRVLLFNAAFGSTVCFSGCRQHRLRLVKVWVKFIMPSIETYSERIIEGCHLGVVATAIHHHFSSQLSLDFSFQNEFSVPSKNIYLAKWC